MSSSNPLGEDKSKYDYMFRYIIVGDSNVGKSCLLLQFTDNKFRQNHEATIGVEFGGKTLEIKNKNVKIQIWDTAGQEVYQAITRGYYKGATGAFVVYDITRKETFEHVEKWLEDVRTNASKDIQVILIGNKKDLENERVVSFDDGSSLAEKHNILFLETSAKTAFNVQEAFIKSAEKILEGILKSGVDPNKTNQNVKISSEDDDDDEIREKKKKMLFVIYKL